VRKLVVTVLLLAMSGCGVELEHGLDERQANQVATLLESNGIAADKVAEDTGGAYQIEVASGDAARAFRLLEAHDLPRRNQKGLAETFAEASLLPSPVEERARLAAALGAELERTLDELPNVVAARVHLALPTDDPLFSEAPPARATASVLLKSRGPLSVGEADVQRLVAGAVPALAAADVSVVMTSLSASDAPAVDSSGRAGQLGALGRVGPFSVARGSRTALATLATSGLVLILLLALGLVLAAIRLGRLRRRVSELEQR
jgi:type III secretion protein J